MKKYSLRYYATAALIALSLMPATAAELNTSSTLRDTEQPQTISRPPDFTNVIDDLPLMPGLELVEDEDVLFAAPKAGRIAETTAQGIVDIDEVYKFYRRSLPQLGWKMVDNRTYERESDRLRIDARAEDKVTTVRFSVRPISESR